MSLRERLAFLVQSSADFRHTGAVQPSSRFLAAAMTEPLRRRRDRPLRVLEMGPGTGAVTRAIVAALEPDDRLECYEINPRFADWLEELLERDPSLAPARDRVVVHRAPAQDVPARPPFDLVVCSVPLNNFDAPLIDEIVGAGLAALRPRGTFTFFEYALLPALRRGLAVGTTRRELAAAAAAKRRILDAHPHTSTLVLRNLPPARAHHLTVG